MMKLLSGALVAAVLTVGMPLTASASDYRDRGDGYGYGNKSHHRVCKLVKKVRWYHGHKRVTYKRVCFPRWRHR